MPILPCAQQIGAYVESEGGSVSLGRLTTVFSGVKKVQMEGHFVRSSVRYGTVRYSMYSICTDRTVCTVCTVCLDRGADRTM